jgi:hypothetical protein
MATDINVGDIVSLTNTDFHSVEELSSSDSNSNNNSQSIDDSSIDKRAISDNGFISIAPDKVINKAVCEDNETVIDTSNLDRNFQASPMYLSACDTLKNFNEIDRSLLSKDSENTSLVNSVEKAKLGLLVRNEVNNLDGGGMMASINNAMLSEVINNHIVNSTGFMGGTLKSKMLLKDLLSICAGLLTSGLGGSNSIILKAMLAALLGVLSCMGAREQARFIRDELNLNEGNRKIVIQSVMMSMNNDNDSNTAERLLLLEAMMDSGKNDPDNTDLAVTMGMTDVVLKNINKNDDVTNSPSTDYDNINSTLDRIDPTWNKDESGNTDYSSLSGNKTMGKLANKKLLTTSPTIPETGEVNTGELDNTALLAMTVLLSGKEREDNIMYTHDIYSGIKDNSTSCL